MLPYVINSGSASFAALNEMWIVASDNPNFELICELLRTGSTDEKYLVSLTSASNLILSGGEDRVKLEDNTLFLDGEALPKAWFTALSKHPQLMQVLLAKVGDTVRVEGDEDAPDGTYEVKDVDNSDPNQRIYLETEEGFFGYPQSLSIKEVHHETG